MNTTFGPTRRPEMRCAYLVVAEPGPISWTLARCLGADGPVSADALTTDTVRSRGTVIVVASTGESGQTQGLVLGQVRRLGHTGHILVLRLGVGDASPTTPADDVLVDVMELPASLADIHARIAARQGRSLGPDSAAAVQSRYDDDELYTFLRSSLGHSSLASIRRTFAQGKYSLDEGSLELAGRYFEKCAESCRGAIDALVGVLSRLTLDAMARRELEKMKSTLGSVSVLVTAAAHGKAPNEMLSRITDSLVEVREAINRVAPKKEAAGGP
jgi:hypothetical protein